MKIFFTLIVFACFTFVAAAQENIGEKSPVPESNGNDDSSNALMAEFQKLAEQWRLAYDSKDAKNLIPLYAENSEYISAHVNGYIARGLDAVIKNFQKGIDGGGFLDTIEVLSITSSCNIAAVVTRYTGTAGGRKVDGRNLLVWKMIDGKWLVVTHMTAVRE